MGIGFSTGALALADFRSAIRMLERSSTTAIELSALRVRELPLLIDALPDLDLARYTYVSIHAPNDFAPEEEIWVTRVLSKVVESGWPVLVHPDTVLDWSRWAEFGSQLLVENMDPRRAVGRTVDELSRIFDRLPDARLCFDIAHARRVDTSMLEPFLILERFADRLAEVHVSELDGFCRHHRLTRSGVAALREVSGLIPSHVPAIIESPVRPAEIEAEIAASLEALRRPARLPQAA